METYNKKVILVTGGTGMVGRAIERVVSRDPEYMNPNEKWIFVGSKDADLSDKAQTQALFEKHRPKEVVHLAAILGGVYTAQNKNLDIFRKNMFINDNVFQTAHEFGVKKIVSCLSTCIFPAKATYPIDETMIHEGEPHSGYSYGYNYSKRMMIITGRGYKEQYGCVYTSVIPCNVFGPHDNYSLEESHVVAGIIRKMFDAKLRGDKTYSVGGTGKPLRQFIYCEDLAKIIIWALRNYHDIEPILATADMEDEISIRDVAEAIKEYLKFEGSLVFDTKLPDGQYRKTATNKKLRSYLPNFKFRSFKDAIKETVDWYVENHKTARN